jgi:hypothetical protein
MYRRLIKNVQNLEPTGANPIEIFFKQIYSISKPGQCTEENISSLSNFLVKEWQPKSME